VKSIRSISRLPRRWLEKAARADKISIGRLLDRVAREWLARREAEEEAEQRRLRELPGALTAMPVRTTP
jgi:hypothetical protein